MSSGEESKNDGEKSPKRLSQIFEPLVEFHSKSAQISSSSLLQRSSSTTSSGTSTSSSKLNPCSSKILSRSVSTPNSPRYIKKNHYLRKILKLYILFLDYFQSEIDQMFRKNLQRQLILQILRYSCMTTPVRYGLNFRV